MKIIIEINEDDFGGVKDGDCITFDECDDYYVKELVTCKDCIWYKALPVWGGIEEDMVCSALIDPMHKDPEDFCSKATRRGNVQRHIRIEKLSE